MAGASERDFSNFRLGDDVHELADGMIPEIAERLDYSLDAEPNAGNLGGLVGAIGKNKILRANEDVTAIDQATAVMFVELSGVQKRLERSIWTPDQDDEYGTGGREEHGVSMGDVANWQDRSVGIAKHYGLLPLHYIAGARVMDTPTEVNNPNVDTFFRNFGRYPREYDYAASVVLPKILQAEDAGEGLLHRYESTSAAEMAKKFFAENPHLLDTNLNFLRVANAGVQLAVEMRQAARKVDPSFDSDPKQPQVYIHTDEFPIARTDAQEDDPRHFQKAHTALRQVAVTALKLHEAAAG